MKKQNSPIIIDQDQNEIDRINGGVEIVFSFLQRAVAEFKKCPFYDPEADLPTIVQNHEGLRSAYIHKLVREMYPVPEGSVLELDVTEESKKWKIPTPQLDLTISEINKFTAQSNINLSFFELKTGRVEVRENVVKAATDRYIRKVDSKRGRRYIELSKVAISALKEMDDLTRPTGTIILNQLHPVQLARIYKYDGEEYADNPHLIMKMEKQWLLMEEEEVKSEA